ncbi:A24 family peptidase [Noviherbaspirillum sedimenti]|uniref:Prepilin peptidase n=1 Tax=Noviherbaspirillum sedimenti TaxID=2320865 RepID=A0A3A3GRS8_9BURK|nr:prepilin peptidase [Noviherbaspirillum sedimenti]RJG03660.1 prepilin peptidase [Noviherbaspirillum sedimenti]
MTQHGLFHLGGFSIEVNAAILITLLGVASCFDIKSRRIPNWLVAAGLVFSLGAHAFLGNGGFSAWALGLLVGFGLFLPLYVVRAMGAGDVKLMGMVGAFLGPASAAGAVLTTLVAGGVLAIAVALWSGALRNTLANVRSLMIQTMFRTLHGGSVRIEALPASAGKLPYAVAIAAGTFIHLLLIRSGHALFA